MSVLFKDIFRICVEARFPPKLPGTRGRPPLMTFDEVYDCLLHVIRTGTQWRYVKPANVSYMTVYKTMQKWMRANLYEIAYNNFLAQYRKKRKARYYAIDSTYVKNVYGITCTGRNPTDRGRKATKLSTIVDDIGVPYCILLTPANMSDFRLFEPTLKKTLQPLDKGKEIFADKGYDSRENRETAVNYGLKDRIFKRKTTNCRRTHVKRGIIERVFSWVDKYRRLILRYEKHVEVYASMTYLAFGVILERRMTTLVSITHIFSLVILTVQGGR